MDMFVDELWHLCHVVDISLTGMLFMLGKPLAIPEPDLLTRYEIHVGGLRILEVRGRHVWRRGEMQAARFVALGDGEHQVLAEMTHGAGRIAVSDVSRLEAAEQKDARVRALRAA
jgi:hypothetical protein